MNHLVAAVFSHPVLTGLVCLALRVFYLLYLHPLSNVPGPKLAAVTDLWKTHAVFRNKFASMLCHEHARHGDIVRIGPNEVSIVAPEEVSTIYGQKSEYLKGPFYDAWSFFGKGHFSDRDPVSHRRRRQLIAGAYSLNYLTSLERYCDSCTELLLSRLDKAAESGSPVDISAFINHYSYDCVSELGFGKRFGFLETGDEHSTIDKLAQATRGVVLMATFSSFSWVFTIKFTSWLVWKVVGVKGPSVFREHGSKYVSERQALKEKEPLVFEEGKDMLYRFMKSKDPATSHPLDTDTLIKNCVTLIVAGSDTTMASMLAFLRYVYSHPVTLKRLREEMDQAIAAGHLTFPVAYAEASRLEFLWACMKEAMRLHPAVAMPLQRVVPPGGRVIGGRFYRAGTLVGMSPREIHYDSRAYGSDASEWCPDRWLEGDRSELEKYSLVFGQGTRVCLGKNISLMEMAKLLPTIVYHYDITIQNPEHPWNVVESWFATQHDFFCTVKKREL
ncbi:cytochrome P450 [Gautieria morchelliformis]|nr:cytochrome P450 [Gautieria morchelliformis]